MRLRGSMSIFLVTHLFLISFLRYPCLLGSKPDVASAAEYRSRTSTSRAIFLGFGIITTWSMTSCGKLVYSIPCSWHTSSRARAATPARQRHWLHRCHSWTSWCSRRCSGSVAVYRGRADNPTRPPLVCLVLSRLVSGGERTILRAGRTTTDIFERPKSIL